MRVDTAKCSTILGLVANRKAWSLRQRHNNKQTRMRWCFTVSVYQTRNGRIRYGNARSDNSLDSTPSPRTIYRIRVYPKRTNQDKEP